jgi:hypothetical protein
VLREGESRLLVSLEDDAERQSFYHEGNGLNVGLYGALDLAHLLPLRCLAAGGVVRYGGGSLRRSRALGTVMSQFVLEDSIRLSVFETLIDFSEHYSFSVT